MPKQTPESFADLMFPTKGLDLSVGFGQQPPGTCPEGINVRAFDVFEQRARGGSRPGLTKYVNDQINGSTLIQGLNTVVGIGYTPPGGGTTTSNITFVQEYSFAYALSISARTIAFPSSVSAGSLLIVMTGVGSGSGQDGTNIDTVVDSLGNTYSATTTAAALTNGVVRLRMWYCISIAGGACTVTVTPTKSVSYHLTLAEYRGVLATNPLDTAVAKTGTSTTPNSGSCAVTTAPAMIVSGFIGFTNPANSVNSPFTLRTSGNVLADAVNEQAADQCTFTQTVSGIWVCTAASFKPAAPSFTALQQSQSTRIVTLVGVSGGTVKSLLAGNTAWAAVTGGTNVLSLTGVVRSSVLNQKLWFADGVNTQYYDPALNSMVTWAATQGSLPGSAGHRWRLICSWRGSIVVSGIDTDPMNWFISATGDPTNWNYAPLPFVVTAAVAGNNSPLGLIGNPMTSLVPYSDDILIFGMDSSIYMLRGHPLAGGQLDRISDVIGMAWGSPWAKDQMGNLYFFSNKNGIYMMTPGQSMPQRMSQQIDDLLADTDTGSNIITMLWDDLWQGLHVFITLAASASSTIHYFWEQRTGAWWQDEFANNNHNPVCCTTFDGNLTTDRRSLLGSWDGYVRTFSETATDDDGIDIASSVVLGPLVSKDFSLILWKDLQAAMGATSSDVNYAVYAGPTAEIALATTPVSTGTWGAGRSRTTPIRRSAHALWLKISSTDRWALEGLRVSIGAKGGKVGRRGV